MVTKRQTIEITRDDIALAEAHSSSHCMIADAIQRQIPNAKRVRVDLQSISWSDYTQNQRVTYLTPRVAQLALINFDQGTHEHPFKFQLPSKPVLTRKTRQAGESERASKHPKKTTVKARARRTVDGGSELTVDGGRPLPTAALANVGKRRAFGLRAMRF